MSKFLLTKTNTQQGVVQNPISSNTYPHILSFENETVREEYINKFIFGDINYDYKTKLAEQKKTSKISINELDGTFTVDKDTYIELGYTEEEILHKDTVVVLDDNGKEKWYAISLKEETKGVYEFDAELDIFFTNDVRNMFVNETRIVKAHIDRYNPDGTYNFDGAKVGEDDVDAEPSIRDVWNKINWTFPVETMASVKKVDEGSLTLPNEYSADKGDSNVLYWAGDNNEWDVSGNWVLNSNKAQYNITQALIDQLTNNSEILKVVWDEELRGDSYAWPAGGSFGMEIGIFDSGGNLIKSFFDKYEYVDPGSAEQMNSGGTLYLKPTELVDGTYIAIRYRMDWGWTGGRNIHKKSVINVETTTQIDIQDVENVHWAVVFVNTQSETNDGTIIGDGEKMTYKVFLAPTRIFSQEWTFKDLDGTIEKNILKVYDHFKKDASIMAIQYITTPFAPFGDIFTYEVFEDTKTIRLILNPLQSKVSRKYIGGDVHYMIDNFQGLDIRNKSAEFAGLPSPSITPYTEKRNIYNEVKLFTEEYFSIAVKSKNSDIFFTSFEYLTSEKILNNIFTFQPDSYKSFSWVEELDTDNYLEGNGHLINDMYELPIGASQWDEYVKQNRTSSKIGGLVALGAIGGGLFNLRPKKKKGKIRPANGLLGIGGIGAGLWAISSRQDKKTSLTQQSSTSSSYMFDVLEQAYEFKYALNKMTSVDMQRMYDYFYANGYSLNVIADINFVINTRYYFNYVQTNGAYVNIKDGFSASEKQIIADSFDSGLTIWHIRDVNTFKGIKNYSYENQELFIIPESVKKSKNEKDN